MKRLVDWRQEEVEAVYHEKELVDLFLTMSFKLEEHMSGMKVFYSRVTLWFGNAAAADITMFIHLHDS